ncbi:MAG: hypothetical protein JWM21_1281 [Acidobacteria bacterium]|nr:hypothetical protein [Acidobacteriota bacterium]
MTLVTRLKPGENETKPKNKDQRPKAKDPGPNSFIVHLCAF